MANPDVSNPTLFHGNGLKIPNHLPYSEAVDEMENAVAGLCDQLDHSADEKEMDCAAWISLLEEYITGHNDRIYYSAISNCIFHMDEERFPDFLSNLGKVVDYAGQNLNKNNDCDKENLYRAVIKFYDHANLAHQQKVTFSSKREDLREDIKREVTAALEPKISGITKDMTSQLVGMIGIFTALSFIVFGGISSLDSIFGTIQGTLENQHSVLPILIVAVAWAICMMNLLFGFMYFVIRITHISETINEKASNIVQRYPVVFFCNYILLALLILFGGMWFAEVNAIGKGVFEFAVDARHSTGVFLIFVILFIAFFGVLGWLLWKWYRPKKSAEK